MMTFSHKARNEKDGNLQSHFIIQASGDQDNNPDGQGNKQINMEGQSEDTILGECISPVFSL